MGSNTETYTKTFSIDIERTNYHLKCKKRRRKRIYIVLVVWAIIFTYMFTPLSKVNLKVSGNVYYTEEELMKLSYISEKQYWWLLDTKSAKKVLDSYEFIDSVKFRKSFFGVKLELNEIYPIGVRNGLYVMNNNEIISKEDYDLNEKINDLTNLDNINDDHLDIFVKKYSDIKLKIRNDFYDIDIVEDSNSYKYVKIYGINDKIGYFVIKVDLVYLNTKFNGNKYNKIIDNISKNNVKYEKGKPALIAYHYPSEEQFELVEIFEEE